MALLSYGIYALRHRLLTCTDDSSSERAFGLDTAMDMAGEYGQAIATTFAESCFAVIGASFGAVLALHTALAARAAGATARRLVLVDPPPAVPKELPVPKMLSSLRTAAMGVLVLYLKTEMGASVLEAFPQLKTLPEGALGYFVAAQCLEDGAVSRDDVVSWADRMCRLLPTYRECRYAFHMFSANIQPFSPDLTNEAPATLMVLSTERWPVSKYVPEPLVPPFPHVSLTPMHMLSNL